jgi:hypothetical protein
MKKLISKKQVQKMVLQYGKPIDLDKFEWDKKTNTFYSKEGSLVIDMITMSNCTFKTGSNCVVVRRDTSETIILKEWVQTQLCPHGIKGHLINGKLNGEPHVIADGILSKIVRKKGDVYQVINYNKTKQSYLIKKDVSGKIYYSHGKTLKEARDSIIFKISDRDLTKWKHLNSKDKVTFEEAIQLYRDVTGACSEGTKYFVEQNKDKKKKNYSIKELIELTKEQHGSEIFVKYFEGK